MHYLTIYCLIFFQLRTPCDTQLMLSCGNGSIYVCWIQNT